MVNIWVLVITLFMCDIPIASKSLNQYTSSTACQAELTALQEVLVLKVEGMFDNAGLACRKVEVEKVAL